MICLIKLIDQTGASVTNKGIYYESGKEPPPEGPPKLHLLVESNEEWRVSRLKPVCNLFDEILNDHFRLNKLSVRLSAC